MRFVETRWIVTFAAVAMGAVGSIEAQSARGRTPVFFRAPPLKGEVHLDLGTGVYTRGPVSKNRGGSTIADFQNLDAGITSFAAVDTGGGSCRWTCMAAKGTAANQSHNVSDLMSDIIFFYCSDALDVSSGGAGGSVTLGFYEGYQVFGGAPTTVAAIIPLIRMPANTAAGSFSSPGAGCFGLRVTFPTLVPFADNQFIGYSWQFDDLGTPGPLGATYPLTACVVSCQGLDFLTVGTSGGVGGGPLGLGEDGQGMVDAIDRDCSAPLVHNTFSFTSALHPQTHSSIIMQIQEASDLVTTNVSYNATLTPNSDVLAATPARLGATWTATLSRIPATAPGTITLTLRRNRVMLPNGATPAASPPFGRVLIAGPLLASLVAPHNGSTGTIAQNIPLQLAYCGLHFAAQARTTGGGVTNIRLSSAVEGTIGSL